jgi:hypothetical protein
VRLETGDSIYFDSGMAHAYINVGAGKCRVLSVCTSDEPGSEVTYAALVDGAPAQRSRSPKLPGKSRRSKARPATIRTARPSGLFAFTGVVGGTPHSVNFSETSCAAARLSHIFRKENSFRN